MMRLFASLILIAGTLLGATAESAGPPPAGVDAAMKEMLQKDGSKIVDGSKVVTEIWFRNEIPTGPKTSETNITMETVPHGTLLGVARFSERGADRRGQTIKPGLYTLRLSFFPQNGDHQGAAPQRDFLLLLPAAADTKPKENLSFKAVTDLSKKASGTPHPLVLSAWKGEGDFKPGLTQEGETDWVLRTKIGDYPLAVIVIGQSDH
jgi:hypothetical protein